MHAASPLTRRSVVGVALPLVLGFALSGCAVHTTVQTQGHHRVVIRTHRAKRRVVVKKLHHLLIGQSADLVSSQEIDGRPADISLRILAKKPTVSTTRLSPNYGDPPENGYYLTFRLRISNRGQTPVLLKPTMFTVDVGGDERAITSYDGAAPYSGARVQLDPVPLAPHRSVAKPLTFDVDATHGTLTFTPLHRPAIRWRF